MSFTYNELNAVIEQIQVNAWVEVYACAGCELIHIDRREHSDDGYCIYCDRSFCELHLVQGTGDPSCLDCLDKADVDCAYCEKSIGGDKKYCSKCMNVLCKKHAKITYKNNWYCEPCIEKIKIKCKCGSKLDSTNHNICEDCKSPHCLNCSCINPKCMASNFGDMDIAKLYEN